LGDLGGLFLIFAKSPIGGFRGIIFDFCQVPHWGI